VKRGFRKFLNRIHCAASLPLFSLLILVACTNVRGTNLLSGSGTGTIATSTTTGNFVLSQLAPDPTTPGSVIDYVGVNEQFDTYCSEGTCMCQFTYLTSSGSSVTVAELTNYQESDLITCNNMIPSGITAFSTQIIVVPGTSASPGVSATPTPNSNSILYASNSLTGNFDSGSLAGTTNYQNLSSASTYVPVQRFQCRKRIFISNPMNPSMIDPFQSQNPTVIYPFNYYTTNVATSLLDQQQSADTSWECTLTTAANYNLQWWANPNVFSAAPCSSSFCTGDGSLIYPQNALSSGMVPVNNPSANGKTRSSFYLAAQPYSVFNVAVQAAVAPSPSNSGAGTASSPAPLGTYTSSTYGVIGYGAQPISNGNGTSSCPAITLPANAYWVKLWNFQATNITSPVIVTGSQSVTQSAIACDSIHADLTGESEAAEIFPSCEYYIPKWSTNGGAGSVAESSQALQTETGHPYGVFGVPLNDSRVSPGPSATPTKLATRVATLLNSSSTSSTSACYNFNAGTGDNNNLTSGISWYNTNPSATPYAGGNDTWVPSPFAFDNTIGTSTISGFPWNLYANALYATTSAGGSLSSWYYGPNGSIPNVTPYYEWMTDGALTSPFVLPAATPMDFSTELTTSPLSADNYVDQLFVVTPASVSDSDMINNGNDIQQYVPVTYRTQSACPGPGPCDPTTNGNSITWGINTSQIGTQGATTYPLCVLQFYD